MLRDIIVNLPVGIKPDVTTPFAVSLANRFKAHLSGIAFFYEPIWPASDMGATVPVLFIEEQEAEAKKSAEDAIARFESAAIREQVNYDSRQIRTSTAEASKQFVELARRFDLAIIAQPTPDHGTIDDLIVEGALFDSGRPILLVPYTQRGPLELSHITICWDGSRPAARAVADATPFLANAKMVDIFIVDNGTIKSQETPGADIVDHLLRHNIEASVERTEVGTDIASAILNHVADRGTDLLVMGGYGHSRIREFILGGATKGIIQSMTVPTLMSH